MTSRRDVAAPGKESIDGGYVTFTKAAVNPVNSGGKTIKSKVGSCGINKPMGDGLTKRQTQWTKRS